MNWYLSVLKNYTKFDGRARRKEYWMFSLFHFIALILCLIVDVSLLAAFDGNGLAILTVLYILATFIPALAVTVRRLHDTGRSGWWYLTAFIPYIGGFILLGLCCIDSKVEDNKYGPNPKVVE